MKAIILLIIVFVFSCSIYAQNNLQLKEAPEIDSDSMWQADTARLFSIIPRFNLEPPQKYSFNPNVNLYDPYLKQNHFQTKRYLKYNYKMPVVGFGGGASHMPFVAPDSTVKYPIKELRIVIIDDDQEPGK